MCMFCCASLALREANQQSVENMNKIRAELESRQIPWDTLTTGQKVGHIFQNILVLAMVVGIVLVTYKIWWWLFLVK